MGLFLSAIVLFRKRWFCRTLCPVGLLLDGASQIGLRKKSWWRKVPSIGRYIVLLTVAGSVIGYPLFLWMDPLAFFSSAFSVRTATNVLSGVLSVAGLVILILIAITSSDLWCARLCPLGATQDLLADIGSLIRNFAGSLKTVSPGRTGIGNAFPSTRRAFMAMATGLGVGFWAERPLNPGYK